MIGTMANLEESPVYDAGVYELQTTDPVQGGSDGVSNKPQKNLANRTTWLKQKVDLLLEAFANALAPLNSPIFTGSPTAPDVPLGDSSGKIANTRFVQGTANGVLTKSVAGGINVTLTAAEAGNAIYVLTGAITANIAVIVPASGKSMIVDNRTTGAFALTLKTAAGTGVIVAQGKKRELFCDGTNVLESTNDLTDAALLGLPSTPTAPVGTDSGQVSSTAFARALVDGLVTVSVAGSSSVTLTPAQADSGIISLTGAITANINVVVPTKSGQAIIANNTTGGFNVTCKTAAGTGVILPQGLAVVVYCDGVNVYLASSSGQVSMRTLPFAPASGATSLTVLGGYTVGNILVEKNGALLEPADFTATNGTTITVGATIAGDTFTVYAFNSFTVADAVAKSGDTMLGALGLAAGSTAPTQPATDSSLAIANTAFVKAQKGRLLRTIRIIRVAGTQYISINGGADTTVGAGSYQPPTDLAFLDVELVGGGGGGGGAVNPSAGQVSLGAPGLSGAYGRSIWSAATVGTSAIACTTGAGGAGGAGAAGSAGGATSFGGLMTAGGGGGGTTTGSVAVPSLLGQVTAYPAAPSGANLVSSPGIAGGPSIAMAATVTASYGGQGGGSMMGSPTPFVGGNTTGIAATSFGSGGSGVAILNGAGPASGGNGGGGAIIIREYA